MGFHVLGVWSAWLCILLTSGVPSSGLSDIDIWHVLYILINEKCLLIFLTTLTSI